MRFRKEQTIITTCIALFSAIIICGCLTDYYFDDNVYITRHYVPEEDSV